MSDYKTIESGRIPIRQVVIDATYLRRIAQLALDVVKEEKHHSANQNDFHI